MLFRFRSADSTVYVAGARWWNRRRRLDERRRRSPAAPRGQFI